MMSKKYGIGLALLTVVLLAGCGTQQSTQNKATSQSTSSQSNSTKSVTAKTKVSLAAAIKKFQQQYPDASVTSIELEDQLGRPVYTLEGVGGTQEHELQLNGRTGKVISKQSEMLDQDDQADAEGDRLNLNKVISVLVKRWRLPSMIVTVAMLANSSSIRTMAPLTGRSRYIKESSKSILRLMPMKVIFWKLSTTISTTWLLVKRGGM